MENKNVDLENYVDRLIEEKKFPESLEKEVMEQIRADLLGRIENRVNMIIISNLSKEKLGEFNELMDKNVSDEEMQKFCSDSIPDLAQLLASELIIFRQTYLS